VGNAGLPDTNTHMQDYMSGARQHTSQGELLRMLEWTPNQALKWADEDRQALKLIKTNYGVAGEAWVRWLVKNQTVAAEMWKRIHERVKNEFEFVDDERY
jgi:hypothetical protein